MFVRYAIFYTPPSGDFADFCAAWLGWNSRVGQPVTHPDLNGLDVGSLTATPRKYGFHGTLKAPFRLADETTANELGLATAALAATLKPVALAGMVLQHHHGFLALRPKGKVDDLAYFAARVVQDLDQFRAPATAGELSRRRQSGLTERQDNHLIKWGYPYILEDFHFHLTLSRRIDQTMADQVIMQLDPLIKPLIPAPFVIDHLTLLGQDADGMFHEIHRYALTG